MDTELYFEKAVGNFSKKLLSTPILHQLVGLTGEQLRYLFSQIYYFVDIFPGYLGMLLWKTNNESIRFAITENLVDECGGIDKIKERDFSLMHNKLLKNFIERIDTKTPNLANKSSHTKILINDLDRLFLHSTLIESLGVMTSMESISTKWFNLLYSQLQERNEFSEHDLYFFKLHTTLDDEHGNILKEILIPLLKGKESCLVLQHCIETVSSIWDRFYTGISNEIHLANEIMLIN